VRNLKRLPVQAALPSLGEAADRPLARVTVSPGAVTYRSVPAVAGPGGSSQLGATAPGFGTLARAGRP